MVIFIELCSDTKNITDYTNVVLYRKLKYIIFFFLMIISHHFPWFLWSSVNLKRLKPIKHHYVILSLIFNLISNLTLLSLILLNEFNSFFKLFLSPSLLTLFNEWTSLKLHTLHGDTYIGSGWLWMWMWMR